MPGEQGFTVEPVKEWARLILEPKRQGRWGQKEAREGKVLCGVWHGGLASLLQGLLPRECKQGY